MLQVAGAAMLSYLIGSIPTAFIIVKRIKRIDVRTVGSGNVGATNVTRVAGFWAGLVVLLLDVAKGLIAVLVIAPLVIRSYTTSAQLACGLCAVLGHVFPIYLKFSGGKGVATTIGVLLGTMPAVAAICLVVWVASLLACRYVSVSSLAAFSALPIVQIIMHQSWLTVVQGAMLTVIIWLRHTPNIKRLLRGDEHRFGLRK